MYKCLFESVGKFFSRDIRQMERIIKTIVENYKLEPQAIGRYTRGSARLSYNITEGEAEQCKLDYTARQEPADSFCPA